MSGRHRTLDWILGFNSKLMLLYPQHFRDEFEEEIRAVQESVLSEASLRGFGDLILVAVRELWALTQLAVVVRFSSPVESGEGQLKSETIPGGSLNGNQELALSGPPTGPTLSWLVGWVFLFALAVPLGWFITAPIAALLLPLSKAISTIGSYTDNSGEIAQAVGLFVGFGLTTSIFQWLLLQKFLPTAQRWIPVSLVGWFISGLVLLFGTHLTKDWGLSTTLSVALATLSHGMILGSAQMLYLRRVLPHAGWWPAITILAFLTLLLVGRSATNLVEILMIVGLPGLISGVGMRMLIARDPSLTGHPVVPLTLKFKNNLNWKILGAALLGVAFAFLLGTWGFAKSQLALAKDQGIYASPEEAILARANLGWGQAQVIGIENVHAGPNYHDGSLPHVWFGGADVYLDRVPEGGRWDHYAIGSYYLHVDQGWVHVPEGALPEYIGWVMALYGLEGARR